MLRRIVGGALALAALAVCLNAAPPQARSNEILAAARLALAGDEPAAIRSFVIKGTLDRGYSLHSRDYGSFEWLAEFPDRFVVVNAFTSASAGDTAAVGDFIAGSMLNASPGARVSRTATRLGLNGDQVIYGPDLASAGTTGRDRFFADPPTQADLEPYLTAARQVFVEITLGLFAAGFAGAPIEFLDSAAPGRAVDVHGPRAITTLTFDPVTHLPAAFGRLRYRDYRTVHGRQVPFRFEYEGRTPGDGRLATLIVRVRDVQFNVPIDDAVFRPWPAR